MWLLFCIAVLAFFAFIVGLLFSHAHRVARQHLLLQQEVLTTLESIRSSDRITREAALQKARRLRRSRDRMERFTGLLGIDPGKYFIAVPENETEIARRLREFGIDPTEVDIPPEVEQIDGTADEAGVLLPPNPTDGRNEGFFRRRRRDDN